LILLKKIISVCFAFISIWLCAIYGIGWLYALKAPLAIEYEGPCLWAAYNLSLGNNIYPLDSLTQEPFIANIYTPVYFLLALPFQKLSGMSLWSLRAISMASFIVTMYFLWRLFNRSTSSKLAASLGVISFASYVSIWSWSLKARVDMVSLAFVAIALDLFHVSLNKDRTGLKQSLIDFAPSIVASVLAVYSKQPSIIIPICIVLFLLLKKRFEDAIAYGGGILALAVLFFIPIQIITLSGFSSQIQFASRFPFSVLDMVKHFGWIMSDCPKMIFALIAIIILFSVKKYKTEAIFPAALFIVSGSITAYTMGTMFPNANHAFLFFLFSSWLTALACASVPWLGFVLLPLCLLSTYITNTMIDPLKQTVSNMPETMSVLAELKPQLKDKVILVEDPVIAMKLDAKPYFVDIATFYQVWSKTSKTGFVPEFFIAEIKAKKYPAIAINKNDVENHSPTYFWSPEIVRAIEQNYDRKHEIIANGETHILYLPKP